MITTSLLLFDPGTLSNNHTHTFLFRLPILFLCEVIYRHKTFSSPLHWPSPSQLNPDPHPDLNLSLILMFLTLKQPLKLDKLECHFFHDHLCWQNAFCITQYAACPHASTQSTFPWQRGKWRRGLSSFFQSRPPQLPPSPDKADITL